MRQILQFASMMIATALSSTGHALSVPFTEDFNTGSENWLANDYTPASYAAIGGPDGGGFVSAEAQFVNAPPGMDAIATFRAEALYAPSDSAFIGQWMTMGVGQLTAYFKHEGPQPLRPFLRVATAANFPGASILAPAEVPPNEWTQIQFEIDPANPLLFLEGPFPFSSVFDNVGNLQIGVEIPAALVGSADTITYSLDAVRIRVPEPASLSMLMAAVTPLVLFRRKRCG